jgi:hypothetical protein
MKKFKSHQISAILATLVLILAVAWASAAIWFDGPASRWAAGILSLTFFCGCLVLMIWLRPYRFALYIASVAFFVVLVWWLNIPPKNDRDWLPEVSRTPYAVLEGNRLTIHNVRNFDYRSETDFSERWETRSFDLDKLRGADLFVCYWGPTLIAHTIASWEFDDGSPLAVSIETRKEQGESYSAIRGFFRQYELYYVVADERDLVRLRTNYRGEQVYLYRTSIPLKEARALLLGYISEINELAVKPKWYNALTGNCTTAIRYHIQRVVGPRPWDWRILANGRLDRLLYERGTVNTTLPFERLRRESDITMRAKSADQDPLFSRRIREGLPARPLPSG